VHFPLHWLGDLDNICPQFGEDITTKSGVVFYETPSTSNKPLKAVKNKDLHELIKITLSS